MRELRILKLLAGLEHLVVLDPVIDRVHGVVDAVLKPRALEDVLHGVPAGHPLHPALVLVPAGAWIGGAVLDEPTPAPASSASKSGSESSPEPAWSSSPGCAFASIGSASATFASAFSWEVDGSDMVADMCRVRERRKGGRPGLYGW